MVRVMVRSIAMINFGVGVGVRVEVMVILSYCHTVGSSHRLLNCHFDGTIAEIILIATTQLRHCDADWNNTWKSYFLGRNWTENTRFRRFIP